MQIKRSIGLALGLLAVLMVTGCTKRYWYRVKIYDFHKPTTPVVIKVVNLSPDKLSSAYEQAVKKSCVKQLRHMGYAESKDSARYEFVLTVKVDTVEQSYTTEHTYWKDGSRAEAFGGTAEIRYKYKVSTLVFRCNMKKIRPGSMQMWYSTDDMYFLNNRFRDILRSKGMVRHIIRTAND